MAVYIGILDAHETMDEMAALVTTYGTRVTRVQIIEYPDAHCDDVNARLRRLSPFEIRKHASGTRHRAKRSPNVPNGELAHTTTG